MSDIDIHVRPQSTQIEVTVQNSGNSTVAQSALRLANPRKIVLDGSTRGSTTFDGSADVTLQTTISTLSNIELEELLK